MHTKRQQGEKGWNDRVRRSVRMVHVVRARGRERGRKGYDGSKLTFPYVTSLPAFAPDPGGL